MYSRFDLLFLYCCWLRCAENCNTALATHSIMRTRLSRSLWWSYYTRYSEARYPYYAREIRPQARTVHLRWAPCALSKLISKCCVVHSPLFLGFQSGGGVVPFPNNAGVLIPAPHRCTESFLETLAGSRRDLKSHTTYGWFPTNRWRNSLKTSVG